MAYLKCRICRFNKDMKKVTDTEVYCNSVNSKTLCVNCWQELSLKKSDQSIWIAM
jgi:hypothetical protein